MNFVYLTYYLFTILKTEKWKENKTEKSRIRMCLIITDTFSWDFQINNFDMMNIVLKWLQLIPW